MTFYQVRPKEFNRYTMSCFCLPPHFTVFIGLLYSLPLAENSQLNDFPGLGDCRVLNWLHPLLIQQMFTSDFL